MLTTETHTAPTPPAPPEPNLRTFLLVLRRALLPVIEYIEQTCAPDEYAARQAYKRWRDRRP